MIPNALRVALSSKTVYPRAMKRYLSTFFLSLSLIGFAPLQQASAQGTITQGEWSLTYPDFSKLGSDRNWKFEVKANGTNQIQQTDIIWLEVFNSAGTSLGSGTYLQRSGSAKSAIVEVTLIYKERLASSDLSKGLTAKMRVDRFNSTQAFGGTFTFIIPTTTFPKRPTQPSEYIKLNSDFTKAFPFPEECTDLNFSYTMNDPYEDIDQVNFDVVDATGKSMGGAYSYGYRSETIQGELSLCPFTLEAATAPFKFQIEIEFDSALNRAPAIIATPFQLASKYAAVEALVAAMPNVCQKGSTYKTAKGNCPAGFKKANFETLSAVQWNTLTRSAGSLKNKKFIVYGCVAQFDSNTGGSKFRAYTLPSPAERYYSGANSMYTGAAKSLLKLSEDDAFAAKVTVSGATTYTTLGGRTSVPSFSIKDFVKIGTC